MLALVLGLAAALFVALWLIPRPVQWGRLAPTLTALGILTAFALGSWALSFAAGAIELAATKVTQLGVPPLVVLLSPLVLAAILGLLAHQPTPPARPRAPSDAYQEDSQWYSSHWRQHPKNAAVDLGTAGYRLELVDGPLAGRTARLRDSRFRLWVAKPVPDGELIVRGAIERPTLQGVTLLGSYGFSHGDEAMIWTPATAE